METLTIKENGVSMDLKGKTFVGNIEIVGPVRDIVIENGSITGEIRFKPKKSALFEGNGRIEHVEMLRAAAPTRSVIRDIKFKTEGKSHQLYLGPGSTYIEVDQCVFRGQSEGPSIYLGRESGYHQIKNSIFETETGVRREVIAIDASNNNKVLANEFRVCKFGGVYLYRNSGEDGVVRYTEPRHNEILDNFFDLHGMWMIRPGFGPIIPEIPYGVILGSRQGNRRYQDLDKGKSKAGSAVDNRDFARENIVKGNYFKGDWLKRWVRDNDKNNTVSNNSHWD